MHFDQGYVQFFMLKGVGSQWVYNFRDMFGGRICKWTATGYFLVKLFLQTLTSYDDGFLLASMILGWSVAI